MNNRYIESIHRRLTQESNQQLFSVVTPIHNLDEPPEPLVNEEIHSKLKEMISSASSEVLILFYKFHGLSNGGKQISEALIALKEKADKTSTYINVHILINSLNKISSYIYSEEVFIGLKDIQSSDYFKIHLEKYSPIISGPLNSKIIIIDSKLAMILSDDPDKPSLTNHHQFETAAMIKGAIVNDMRDDFNNLWANYTNTNLTSEVKHDIPSTSSSDLSVPCFFISKKENGNPLIRAKSPYKLALLAAINLAQHSINIITTHINDPDICHALAKVCNAGVHVSMVIGKYHHDQDEYTWDKTNRGAIAKIFNLINYQSLANLEIRYAATPDGIIAENDDPYSIHAKYLCIDHQLVFIGSSPLNIQSMNYTRETDFVFEDQKTALLFENKFFIEAYVSGIDYFKDTYDTLFIDIELEYKRIRLKVNPDSLQKADGLQMVFQTMAKTIDHPLKKIESLIKQTLPVLEVPTGNKPGLPYSYNTIYWKIIRLGFKSILQNMGHPNIFTFENDAKASVSNSPYTLKFSDEEFRPLQRSRSLSDGALPKKTNSGKSMTKGQ